MIMRKAEEFFKTIESRLLWVAMRTFFIGCTVGEVESRRYENSYGSLPDFATAPDGTLEFTREIYDREYERGEDVGRKVQSLLGLASLVLSLVIGLMTITSAPLVGLAPLFFSLITIVAVAEFFSVDAFMKP